MSIEYSPRELFKLILESEPYYNHVENDGSYFTVKTGDTLYLLLQWSNGKVDWKNNFDFATKPYKDMPKTWRAHRGFVRVWKSIEPYVKDNIMDKTIQNIVVAGYSHGAALAVLAHEYIWYNRPDIRDKCITFAFEAPRVFCGIKVPYQLRERWSNLYVYRTCNDLVTHVPPHIFGYKHVGNLINLVVPTKSDNWTKHTKFDFLNSHYPDNVDVALWLASDKKPFEPTDRWIYEKIIEKDINDKNPGISLVIKDRYR